MHVFETRKASTFRLESFRVALHGRSFKEAATEHNLVTGYPPPVEGWLNIGVLHTALEGYKAHATYAPCSLAELVAKGYDYWALGHVHEHAILHQKPWIVFPGNLQGRHIRETGARGAILVNADESGIRTVERLPVDVLRWHRLEVDISEDQTLEDVVRRVGRAFGQLLSATPDDRYLSVRVVLKGRSAAHGLLFGLESQLREEVLGQAAGQGVDRLWVEKVRIESLPPLEIESLDSRSDAFADLQELLVTAPEDESLLKSLLDDLRPLVDRASQELMAAVPELETIRRGDMAALVRAVTPDLIARLAHFE